MSSLSLLTGRSHALLVLGPGCAAGPWSRCPAPGAVHTLDLQTSSPTTGCPVAPSTPRWPIWGRDLEMSPHFHDAVPSSCLGPCPSPTLNHHTGCIQSCSKLNLEKDVSSSSKLIGSPRLNPVWLHCSQWQRHGGGTVVASPTSWGHCRYPALLLNPKTSHLATPASLAARWCGSGKRLDARSKAQKLVGFF